MRIGIQFDGFSSVKDAVAAARAADEAGAASLWFAQHMGYREAFVSAAAAACSTERATIVPLAISPYLSPPLLAAMSVASLVELAPGRIELAVSIGNLMDLGESGQIAVRPLKVMREYVTALRDLLAGNKIDRDGETFNLRGAHMEFLKGLEIPIHMATTGPKMLKLGGRIADGIVLSTGLTLETTRRFLSYVDHGVDSNGNDASPARRIGLVFFCVDEDGAEARRTLVRKLAYLFRSRGHAENIKSAGLDIDHEAIIAANARRDLEEAAALLPIAAASMFGVAGTPKECPAQLEKYLAAGLDEPILCISGDPESSKLALRVVRDMVD